MKKFTRKMIYKYPNKPWNWAYLSANPNISKQFIEQFINFPWRWIMFRVIKYKFRFCFKIY